MKNMQRSTFRKCVFALTVPFVFSLSAFPTLAGNCAEAEGLAGEIDVAWNSYKAGKISRSSYDRAYAHFMRSKLQCLTIKASSFGSGDDVFGKNRVPVVSTNVRPSSLPVPGEKSIPYKLHGKYYYIEVSGTIGLRPGDPNWTGYRASDTASADACYFFYSSSFPNADPQRIPEENYIFRNSGGRDVCRDVPYNPDHVYRSEPFFSDRSYRFWVDFSGFANNYFSVTTGGMLHVNVYEFDSN